MLEDEGLLRPTASQVARRAGVSRRALYVHFETIEGLIAAAIERRAAEVRTAWPEPPLEAPLDVRIKWFCQRWSHLAEALVPLRRAAAVHEPFSPQISAVIDQTRRWARTVVEWVFLPELATMSEQDRAALATALHHAASWSAWDDLRLHGADFNEANDAMRRLITALLTEDNLTPA